MDSHLRDQLEELVEEKISSAIANRKKEVTKQFKTWTGIVSLIFAALLFVGFSIDDFLDKIREKILPTTHIVNKLSERSDNSQKLKDSILNELRKENIAQYPEVKAGIKSNVWEAINTNDPDKLQNFIDNSGLDEAIIDSYYKSVIGILFSDLESDSQSKIDEIKRLGAVEQAIVISEYKNPTGSHTACNLPFIQAKKRVIIFVPGADPNKSETRDRIPVPWFQCPRGYVELVISLRIEDVVVSDILVVGVERPSESKNIDGIRARVTKSIAEEFKTKGIDLGRHITSGYVKVTNAF